MLTMAFFMSVARNDELVADIAKRDKQIEVLKKQRGKECPPPEGQV